MDEGRGQTALRAHLLMSARCLLMAVLLAFETLQWTWSVLLYCDVHVCCLDAPWQRGR